MTELLLKIYQTLLAEYGCRHKWYGDTQDEIINGAILTQNTNWLNVEKALANLREKTLLSLPIIAKMSAQELAPIIRPCGYHNQKALRLIDIAQHLTQDNLPQHSAELRAYLLSLKGLGNETVDCIMLYAYGFPYFVIDAYTIRIFSRLGLCATNITYLKLQEWFMHYLKPDVTVYSEYHALLISLAKSACNKQPKCHLCPLNNICKYAQLNT